MSYHIREDRRAAVEVYVPGEGPPGRRNVRVVPVVIHQPGHVTSYVPLMGFRARCEKCGWLGRPQTTLPAALRTAKGHTCLPVAGGVAVPVSGWSRVPWLPPR